MIRGDDHRPNEDAAPAAARGARRRAAGVHPPRADARRPTGEALEGARARRSPTCATPGSRRGRARVPGGARTAAHDVHSTCRGCAGSRSRRSRRCRTRSWPRAPARRVALVPVLRGARDLDEARECARPILGRRSPAAGRRARDARALPRAAWRARLEPRALVRELKAVGGDLKALRLALTGRERGPELWAVLAALPREETLRRVDAALIAARAPLQHATRAADELPAPPGADPHVLLRPDRLPAHPRRQRAAVRDLACGCARWLRARGYDVTLVENITDINDKIYDAAPGASAELAARGGATGTSRTPTASASAGPTSSRTRPRRSRRSSR